MMTLQHILSQDDASLYGLLSLYEPVAWEKPSTRGVAKQYSVRGNHGVSTAYELRNLNDSCNVNKSPQEASLIDYWVGDTAFTLMDVETLYAYSSSLQQESTSNLVGLLRERIANSILSTFLARYFPSQQIFSLPQLHKSTGSLDDRVVAHTDEYVLKATSYPNLVLLQKQEPLFSARAYKNIKELDGLYLCKEFTPAASPQHLFIVESKSQSLDLKSSRLQRQLCNPLQKLFPQTQLYYALFADKDSLYLKKNFQKNRLLKTYPKQLYSSLKENDVATLFFSFNESVAEIENMARHLLVQYNVLQHKGFSFSARIVRDVNSLSVFDSGKTPQIKLRKRPDGLWEEVYLAHKKKDLKR